ncbi:MAG: type II secretion system protein [Phycisphaeraceae bacterium]|nr:type II secretion system protein [Phycisphaeraceae bacterium]MCB9847130.1 type II secretion system protein [Phycisphaeraceae bacterium]
MSGRRTHECVPRRRGVTLLELMLALSVTVMVGVGVASMLAMISASTRDAREARSLLLRAHAGQIRMRSYLDSALRLLQYDPDQGLAIWLHDQRTEGQVNLSELRVFWYDDVAQTLSVEWVNFPESWTELQVQTFDVTVPDGSDYFAVMEAQRAGGMTASLDLIEDVTWFDLDFDDETITDATRVVMKLELLMDETGGSKRTVSAFGLANHE